MLKDSDLTPYKPIHKHPPDRLTYIVRFICGAAVGLIMGCIASVFAIEFVFRANRYGGFAAVEEGAIFDYEPLLYSVCGVAIILFVLVFGFGAMILGDRFWGKVIDR